MFFMLFAFFGIIIHYCRCSNNDRRDCCHFCIGSCPVSGGSSSQMSPLCVNPCLALLIVFVVLFMLIGIANGLFAATIIQRIWQRHYHVLAKKELTKV